MLVVNLFVPHQLLKRWWTMFGRIMNVSPQRTTQLTNWTQYIDELSVLVHNKEGDEYSVGVVIWFLLCPRYLFVLPQIYSSLRERTIHIYIYSSCLYYFRKVCPYAFITARTISCTMTGGNTTSCWKWMERTHVWYRSSWNTCIHSRRWSVCHFALICIVRTLHGLEGFPYALLFSIKSGLF